MIDKKVNKTELKKQAGIADNIIARLCGFPHEEEVILEPMDLIQQYQEKRASLNTEIDHVLDQITSILGDN